MTDAPPALRGVVVGLGVMGSLHTRVLSSIPGVAVVAAVDPSEERRHAAVATHHQLRAHATLAEALAAHELDFAAIAVPVEGLPTAARTALDANLHVLVEKPTAPSEGQAVALAELAEARGVVLSIGHVERFNPAVRLMKRKIEDGVVGRVIQMQARRLSPFPNRDAMRGAALDLATHDIDVMRFLSGSDVMRVYAETDRVLQRDHEDVLCATLRFDDGMTGVLDVNWLTPTKVRQLSVTGERGMLTVDYLTQELRFYEHPTRATRWDALASLRGGGEGDMIRYALERREPLRIEWEAFFDAVRSGGPPPVSARDGAAALSTARAIQRSGETHEVVVPSYRMVATA